jgi:chromosome partitioning protein
MDAKVVSFVNFKGGVGKTVSAVNISGFLAGEFGKKVLLVDVDPQANATLHLMEEERYCDEGGKTKIKTLYDVLEKYKAYTPSSSKIDLENVILTNVVQKGPPNIVNLHLLPSDLKLVDADREFTGDAKAVMLKRELEEVKGNYDYIIIDCPPNLSLLTRNALFASDYCIIPLIPDYLSTTGLHLLLNKLEEIGDEHRNIGKEPVKVKGVLFTRVQPNTKLHQERMTEVKNFLGKKNIPCFNYYVRNLIGVQEAPNEHLPLCCLKSQKKYADAGSDYRNVTEEFIRILEGE